VLVELIDNHLRRVAAPHLKDNAHSLAVRLIAHVCNSLDFLVAHEVGDLLDQFRLVYLVRNFRNDNGLAPALELFRAKPRAQKQFPAARRVSLANSLASAQIPARREIRAGQDRQNVFERRFRVINEMHEGVNHFAQVVRRDICRHAPRDACRAVHEKVRERRRQNHRFHFLAVVIGHEIDGFLVDVRQHQLGK